MGRAAQRDGRQPRRHRRGDRGAGAERQHEGQRAGPEGRGEPFGAGIDQREPHGRGEIGHVDDQRVEIGPPLGTVDRGHGLGPVGPRGEPVDRLGRQGDRLPRGQPRGGLGNRRGIRGKHERAVVPGHRAGL